MQMKAKFSPHLTQPVKCFASVSSEHRLGAMPPNYVAKVGDLETFTLPSEVTGNPGDIAMGHALVDAWRRDGILQVAVDKSQKKLLQDTFAASKRFFGKPHYEKASCVDSQSYAGYIASGEEITDGIADYSEIFTVTKDLDLSDPRVQNKWPCHGPCPWPDIDMKNPMTKYMDYLNTIGEKLLKLIECGLNLGPNALTQYTKDGWHHMRILRYVSSSLSSCCY
jgi:isopenicillin N synthase-like dioxygenase